MSGQHPPNSLPHSNSDTKPCGRKGYSGQVRGKGRGLGRRPPAAALNRAARGGAEETLSPAMAASQTFPANGQG